MDATTPIKAVDSIRGTNAVEGGTGTPTGDLTSYLQLPALQKVTLLAALGNDPRFSSVMPTLETALEAETVKSTPALESPTMPRGVMGYRDVADVLDEIRDKGHGNIEYWMKTCTDNARAVRALSSFVAALAGRETGTLQQRLEDLATKLASVSSAGTGNLDYWVDRSADIRNVAHNVARQMRELAPVARQSLTAKQALSLLANFARSTSSKGLGDIDYWMRSCADAASVAHAAGRAIASIAVQLPEPDRTVVLNVANQLQEVSSAGHGTVHYWSGRTSKVVGEIHRLADSLDEIVRAM